MLKRLYIKNFTLIDELDIDFYQGFSVITGETGAGKSIILGAIGLLLGQRADSKVIKDKCVIEAHFDISRYGMETFFTENDIEYDDTPVQLVLLKELGEQLIDIHSQHQNLLLNKQDFQLSVVDIIADNAKPLTQYQQTYSNYLSVSKELESLREAIDNNRQNQDFLQFQYEELTNANLVEDEQEELEQKSDTMSHAEEIKSALYEADNALSADETGIVSALRTARTALSGIQWVFPDASELAQRLESSYIELKDISEEISNQLERVDFDPAELDAINNRLDRLYDLEKKYHVENVSELIAKREELKSQLNNIENSDEALAALQQRLSNLQTQAKKEADILTKRRQKAAQQIEKEMQSRLVPLGMPNVRFSIQITEDTLGRTGQDKVAFLFSANTSTPLQPVSQVASGGEIARVMLSLKMGRHERQVISITHLPQIAALGTTHYKVEKEETVQGTISRMTELSSEERIREIAQMLSGSDSVRLPRCSLVVMSPMQPSKTQKNYYVYEENQYHRLSALCSSQHFRSARLGEKCLSFSVHPEDLCCRRFSDSQQQRILHRYQW